MVYTLTDAEVAQINKMNVASQRADLGDVIQDNQEEIAINSASIIAISISGSSSNDQVVWNSGSIVAVETAGSLLKDQVVWNSGSIVAVETAGSAQDTLISWNSGSIAALEILSVTSGSYAAVLADADASSIAVATGTTSIAGYLVDVFQSGSNLIYNIATSGSELTITPTTTGSWNKVAVGDLVNWIVF